MLPHLHTTITSLLHTHGRIDPGEVDVRFERPTRQWVESLVRPTVNLFLFDLAENSDFRNASAQTVRANGRAVTRLAPRRIDLRFLVCALSSAIADEEALLWRVLGTLLRHTNLLEVWPEELPTPETPVGAKVGPFEDAPRTLDLWGALELPPRPALLYSVTAPLDLEQVFEAPLVLSRSTRFVRSRADDERAGRGIDAARITARTDDVESFRPLDGVAIATRPGEMDHLSVLLAGVVRDRQGEPLPGVRVGVEGRTLAYVTDEAGRFQLAGLPAGTVTLLVERAGEPPRRIVVEAPWAFDIVLSL